MILKQKITNAVVCSVVAVLALVFQIDAQLKTSEAGLKHVAKQEGCRLNAYQCSAFVYTAGLGHTKNVTASTVLTKQQVADYFIEDVAQAENSVDNAILRPALQHEYDMMVSFVYNLGAGNFKKSTLLKKFNRGENKSACGEYLRWIYVDGKNCQLKSSNCAGIVKRRQQEQKICLNGYEHAAN